MRKKFSKVLALSLSSLILLSNLFVLTAKALNLAYDNVSSSEESTVECEPETQISKVAPKTTASKVVASEAKATELEPKVETIEPEVEPNVDVAEEVPVEEEPETVLPEGEEVVAPEIKVDNSKLEETTPEVEVSVPEIKVDSSKLEETTPKVKVTLPKIKVDSSKLEGTTPKAKVTLPKIRVDSSKLEETTPKVEVTLPEIKVEGSRLGEITPKVEVTLPEIKVDASKLEETTPEVEVTLPEIKVDNSKLEGTTPKVEVTLPEIKVDGSILTMPKVEVTLPEIKVDSSKLEETTPEVEASLPEIKVDSSKLEETTPEVEAQVRVEELLVSETGTIARGDYLEGYGDKITKMLSNPEDKTLRLHSVGNPNEVNFAIFTCNTTMCDGFKNGVAEFYEGRRGESDMEVTAPNAKTGYVFVRWVKLGTAPVSVGEIEVPVDVYQAVYEKVADEIATENSDSTLSSGAYPNPDMEQLDPSVDGEHDCFKPKEGKDWTSSSVLVKGDEISLTVSFRGCYGYVSTARFVCDLNKCEGFDGLETFELSRRGGCKETIVTPKAKEGFKFDRWEKSTVTEYETTVDVYTAVYTEV